MLISFRHITGSKSGLSETFDQDKVRLGRDPANDLNFDPYLDRDASGFHAEIYEDATAPWITDVGSTNGTYVNGERIAKKRLDNGDVIGLGRSGPKIRFFLGDAPLASEEPAQDAGRPEPAPQPEKKAALPHAPAEPGKPLGESTVQKIVNDAVAKAKQGGRSGGTAVFVRKVVQEAFRDTSRKNRRVVFLAIVIPFVLAFSAAVAVGAWMFMEQARKIREQEKKLEDKDKDMQAAMDKVRHTEELLTAIQERFRTQFLSSQQEETEARRQLEESKGRIERLEGLISSFGDDKQKAEELRSELARARNERTVMQQVQQANEPSLLIIFTSFTGRNASTGVERTFQSFGTGFIATTEGHVITNKHVIQPWKFAQMKKALDAAGMAAVDDSVLVAAWKSGSQVYKKKAGSMSLNLDAGYNNRNLQNLEIFNCAPDHMEWISVSAEEEDGGSGGETKQIYAHAHDNNDLAVIRITDRFSEARPVRLAAAAEMEKLRKLDPVLALGFPRGGSLLERGIAEPSASRGDIRKIEDSILISAPIIGGNSGGPIFSENGSVIGVSTRTIKGVESFGFCIPIRHAVELLPPEYR